MTQSKNPIMPTPMPMPMPMPRHPFVAGAILAAALCFTGCYGEQLSLYDLECKSKSDCVIKDVPVCTGCMSDRDQEKIPTCVPADYDPPSKINCRTSTGDTCASRIQINDCECKHVDFGDEPAPDRICSGVAADAGAF